jgi:hypothetical protein
MVRIQKSYQVSVLAKLSRHEHKYSCVLYLVNRKRGVVDFTLRPLYPRERKLIPIKLEALRITGAVWTVWRTGVPLAHAGFQTLVRRQDAFVY